MFRRIRFKLSLITFVLIALITAGSFLLVIKMMDMFLLTEFVKKGISISRSAATSAGYSISAGDRLALDNLTTKTKQSQKDILSVVIVGEDGIIKAHNELEATGKIFTRTDGELIKEEKDGSIVKKINRKGNTYYEFTTPILFADKMLGEICIGIDTDTLMNSKIMAKKKIVQVFVIVLTIGALGIFFLSSFITTPIKKLIDSVSRLKDGKYEGEIRVVSRDELGELTTNFNEMAKLITVQKNRLEDYAKELENAYLSLVRILAAAIDARDRYTLGHSTRIARLSLLMGEKLGLKEKELRDLEMACLIHDVGKIRIPDNIINKNARLSGDEYNLMRKHPGHGADILRLAKSLHKYIPAVLHHHEWYNGNGYPHGLQKDDIPLFALIIAIADAYDAMTSSRSYREGMSTGKAVEEILRHRGTQFDPHITDFFMEALKDYENGRKLSFLKVDV